MQSTPNCFFLMCKGKIVSYINTKLFGVRSKNKNLTWKLYEIECSNRNGIAQLCLALCITSDNIDYDAWIMPYQQHRCSPGAYLRSKSKWKKEIFIKLGVSVLNFCFAYFVHCEKLFWNIHVKIISNCP